MDVALLLGVAIQDERKHQRQAFKRLKLFRRMLRDFSNPFLGGEENFRRHYRLTPQAAILLIELLSPQLQGVRSTAIPPHLQVLSALRFFAEGGLQKGVASDYNHPMCQGSMSKVLNKVLTALLTLSRRYIHFPTTREERLNVSSAFNPMRNILGLIDFFKVTLWRSTENEENYINYAVGPSVNVQAISDGNNFIRNIRVCAGSNTDHFIWIFGKMKTYLEWLRQKEEIERQQGLQRREGRYYLLGDSGYTLSPILLTPFTNPVPGSPQSKFNDALRKTRCNIEQCFGILSNVLRCISRSRKLCYSPKKVAKIVTACAILHNFRKLHGGADENEVFLVNFEQIEVEVDIDENDFNYQQGLAERQPIVDIDFT